MPPSAHTKHLTHIQAEVRAVHCIVSAALAKGLLPRQARTVNATDAFNRL